MKKVTGKSAVGETVGHIDLASNLAPAIQQNSAN